MVLDFTLTLILNHTILTTYYASSFPTSLFFWVIMGGSATLIIVFAEQLCVRREMREGLKAITAKRAGDDRASKASSSSSRNLQRRQSMTPGQEEIFNAHLAGLDDEPDPDIDLDVDEQIELLERGPRPGASTSNARDGS